MGVSELAIFGSQRLNRTTYQLCVELGQARLALAIKDQEGVDHGHGGASIVILCGARRSKDLAGEREATWESTSLRCVCDGIDGWSSRSGGAKLGAAHND
jgi:hypothetical protein